MRRSASYMSEAGLGKHRFMDSFISCSTTRRSITGSRPCRRALRVSVPSMLSLDVLTTVVNHRVAGEVGLEAREAVLGERDDGVREDWGQRGRRAERDAERWAQR